MSDEVLSFISRFTGRNKPQVEETFTCGCCYWFAKILEMRFAHVTQPVIMYDSTINHFGTNILGRVYDITGDVTNDYIWKPWNEFDDDLERRRIMRDCILF